MFPCALLLPRPCHIISEWDVLQRITIRDISDSNLELMRQFAVRSMQRPGPASSSMDDASSSSSPEQ